MLELTEKCTCSCGETFTIDAVDATCYEITDCPNCDSEVYHTDSQYKEGSRLIACQLFIRGGWTSFRNDGGCKALYKSSSRGTYYLVTDISGLNEPDDKEHVMLGHYASNDELIAVRPDIAYRQVVKLVDRCWLGKDLFGWYHV